MRHLHCIHLFVIEGSGIKSIKEWLARIDSAKYEYIGSRQYLLKEISSPGLIALVAFTLY